MRYFVRLFDWLFLLRPTLFYPIWTYYLAGHWSAKAFGHGENGFHRSMGLFGSIAALSLVVGSIYILNQIRDRETDRINHKLFLLSEGHIPVGGAYIEAGLLAVIGLLWGFWIDQHVGFVLLALLAISGYGYNYPPFCWKDRAIMGLVTNAVSGYVLYSLGWATAGGHPVLPMRGLAYMLAGACVYLNTTLPDLKGDAASGKITFGVKYGVKATARWALILEIATVIVAGYFKEWILFIPALVVLPLYVWGATRSTVDEIMRATKYSVLALAIGVCVVFPLYLIPVFVVFFMTRWYYKARFNFDYPNFKS
ncbi:UbiA family prenyltransferase [bacterium]|nr:UbiA family prenyltransferase [bacterium]